MQSGLSFLVSFSLLALLSSGDPGIRFPRSCSLRHYYTLDSKTLAAVKTFRDLYDQEMQSWEKRNCTFSRRKEPREVSPCTRLHLLALTLANSESVLQNLSHPALATSAGPVLELLSAVRRDVVFCMTWPSPDSLPEHSAGTSTLGYDHRRPRPDRSGEMSHLAEARRHPNAQPWLRGPERKDPRQGKGAQTPNFDSQISPIPGKQEGVDQSSKNRRKSLQERRLPKAKRMESPRCREAETILNLPKLLTFDLKLAILTGSCV